MIVTITANPSLDRTYRLAQLVPGGLNRADHDEVEASGKGVNVSRALAAAGQKTTAVLAVGGAEGQRLLELLDADGVAHQEHHIDGHTRTNITVIEPDRTTKVNAAGPALTDADVDALLDVAAGALSVGDWLVVAGAEPPGVTDLAVRAVDVGHAAGARVAVDTSGPALARAHAAGADLLAPNAAELADWSGRPLPDGAPVEDVLLAARELLGPSGTALLISLGPDGALYVDGGGAWHARGPRVTAVNTAGAGDALLAGFLQSAGTLGDRLATAVAWGTAACLLPTTSGDIGARADPDSVVVTELTVPTPSDRLEDS